MTRSRRMITTAIAVAALTLAITTGASAHNAAHLLLADGTCLGVGSNKEAPLVGPDRVQLDLVPETVGRDEYGARFAANQSPRLLPGECPAN